MFEAAVVLEAWAGVPAEGALEAGRQMTRAPSGAGTPSLACSTAPRPWRVWRSRPSPSSKHDRDRMLGRAAQRCPRRHVLERALIIALPLTIALQWAINSRYLSRPRGTVHLGRHPLVLALLPGGLILVRPRWSAQAA